MSDRMNGGHAGNGAPAADREREREGKRRLRGFLNHLLAYFAVMVVIVPVNALTTPDNPWFLFLLVGWGAPLALHAAYAMGLFGRKKAGG